MYHHGLASRSGNVVTVNYAGDITKLTAYTTIIIGNVGSDKIPASTIAAPCYFSSNSIKGQVMIDTSGDISLYVTETVSTREACRFSVAYIL